MVWLVSILYLISNKTILFSRCLMTVPRAQTMICITITSRSTYILVLWESPSLVEFFFQFLLFSSSHLLEQMASSFLLVYKYSILSSDLDWTSVCISNFRIIIWEVKQIYVYCKPQIFLKRTSQENEKFPQDQTILQQSHQRDEHLGCPHC